MKPILLLTIILMSHNACSSTQDEFEKNKYLLLEAIQPKNNIAFDNACNALKNDEVSTFTKHQNSLLSDRISKAYSASSLISLYSKNELKANKVLSGKWISVKTVASEIGQNIKGDAYIKADGNNQFESILLNVNKDDDRVLNLEKNDKIDLACKSSKYIMHTPVLDGCIFRDQLAEKLINDLISCQLKPEIKKDDIFKKHIALIIYKSIEDKIEKTCLNGTEKQCLDIITNITKDSKFNLKQSLTNNVAPDKIKLIQDTITPMIKD